MISFTLSAEWSKIGFRWLPVEAREEEEDCDRNHLTASVDRKREIVEKRRVLLTAKLLPALEHTRTNNGPYFVIRLTLTNKRKISASHHFSGGFEFSVKCSAFKTNFEHSKRTSSQSRQTRISILIHFFSLLSELRSSGSDLEADSLSVVFSVVCALRVAFSTAGDPLDHSQRFEWLKHFTNKKFI